MTAEHLAEERRGVLRAALPHVAFDGWTAAVLRRAARDAGYDEAMAIRAFPGGPGELIAFFVAETDRRMEEELAGKELSHLPIRERIALAVRTRLTLVAPHREAVRLALLRQSRPREARRALTGLYRTVDAIWCAVGDLATDFSFYSKRALLAGVYSATLLFWLNDQSDDFADTWAFLDRRIGDVMQIQKARDRVSRLCRAAPSPGRLLRSIMENR